MVRPENEQADYYVKDDQVNYLPCGHWVTFLLEPDCANDCPADRGSHGQSPELDQHSVMMGKPLLDPGKPLFDRQGFVLLVHAAALTLVTLGGGFLILIGPGCGLTGAFRFGLALALPLVVGVTPLSVPLYFGS